jgi:DNA-binding beta-propeller fold protein YncE
MRQLHYLGKIKSLLQIMGLDRDGNRIKVINTQTNKVENDRFKRKYKRSQIAALPESNKVAVIDYVSNNLLILLKLLVLKSKYKLNNKKASISTPSQ